MVLDDNLESHARSAEDVVKWQILMAQEQFLGHAEIVRKHILYGVIGNTAPMQACLEGLFSRLYPLINRTKEKETLRILETLNPTEDKELEYRDMMIIYYRIAQIMDDLHITKIDTQRKKPLDIVERNKLAGQS